MNAARSSLKSYQVDVDATISSQRSTNQPQNSVVTNSKNRSSIGSSRVGFNMMENSGDKNGEKSVDKRGIGMKGVMFKGLKFMCSGDLDIST